MNIVNRNSVMTANALSHEEDVRTFRIVDVCESRSSREALLFPPIHLDFCTIITARSGACVKGFFRTFFSCNLDILYCTHSANMEHNQTHNADKHSDPAGWMPFLLLFIVIAGFFIWCCCVGAWLARLWYYDGQLHRKFPKYDIQPAHVRERLAREEERTRRESQKVVDLPRWNRDVATMSFERVQEFDDSNLRQRIFESKRISRLPAFEQDDGGDGSEFPDMPVDMTADEYNDQHFPRQANSFLDLDLSELDQDDWLTYDNNEQETARDQILEDRREDCIQIRPGREAEEACGELWQEVAKFLTMRDPKRFWEQKENNLRKLYDDHTRESYPLNGPFGWLTLDTMARLVREDFNIFFKSPFSGQFTL